MTSFSPGWKQSADFIRWQKVSVQQDPQNLKLLLHSRCWSSNQCIYYESMCICVSVCLCACAVIFPSAVLCLSGFSTAWETWAFWTWQGSKVSTHSSETGLSDCHWTPWWPAVSHCVSEVKGHIGEGLSVMATQRGKVQIHLPGPVHLCLNSSLVIFWVFPLFL